VERYVASGMEVNLIICEVRLVFKMVVDSDSLASTKTGDSDDAWFMISNESDELYHM
jgi:hypothetical protein